MPTSQPGLEQEGLNHAPRFHNNTTMTASTKKTFRMPQHLADAIERHAEQTGNSAAAVMRTALTRQLTSEKSEDRAGGLNSKPSKQDSYSGNSVEDET
jgi:Arc/MetJ-type ribon-helix-helix transcriptional regulator